MAEHHADQDVAGENAGGLEHPAARQGLHRGSDRLATPSPRRNGASADWRRLRSRLDTIRGKWDLAVLMNLERGVERPGDLIDVINEQAEEQISWKVLIQTLRRLEDEGYVNHREVSRLPRVTRYWLRPTGRRVISALARLDAWYAEDEQCTG